MKLNQTIKITEYQRPRKNEEQSDVCGCGNAPIFNGALRPGSENVRPESGHLIPNCSFDSVALRYPIVGRYMRVGSVLTQIFQCGQQRSSMFSFGVLPQRPVLFYICFLQFLYHLLKCLPVYPVIRRNCPLLYSVIFSYFIPSILLARYYFHKRTRGVILIRMEHLNFDFPVRAHIELSSRCNFRCLTCKHATDNSGQDMTDNTCDVIIKEIIPNLNELEMQGTGEALLNRNFERVFDAASQNNQCHIVLITNASLLNNRIIQKFVRSNMRLVFSIDGSNSDSFSMQCPVGRFDKVVEMIKLVRDERKKIINPFFPQR